MTWNVADTRFTCAGIGPLLLVRDVSEIRGDYGWSKPALGFEMNRAVP
ncbi:MAG: hypothetical protein GX427_02770 [Actinomycetales bacterium]|nr:hypothetical protein [Actinomycetales bacterium]